MESSIWSESVWKEGSQFAQGRPWPVIAGLDSYVQTCNWARPDISLDETKLIRHSTGVEVACRARIRTCISRPPTGSDDPYVGETNWSRGNSPVGRSPEKALDRRTMVGGDRINESGIGSFSP
ncbi:hypothetical protein L1987_37529 [Smallanthus sonchifolius]|uniref:Uncharacterized protein n=1 Tax=Smallanthus sonchifolius TaxID=185202 RepID=A0ACB9HG62_9ASTR|nr:hypothetical protein L1987_37529 [Smallanthus sonchifolius]